MAIDSYKVGGTVSLIPNGNTTMYTATSNVAVTCMWVCNTYVGGSPSINGADLTLHFVKNGDPLLPGNMIVNALPVPAGETVVFDSEKIILDNGDRIVASASKPGLLSFTISTIQV